MAFYYRKEEWEGGARQNLRDVREKANEIEIRIRGIECREFRLGHLDPGIVPSLRAAIVFNIPEG